MSAETNKVISRRFFEKVWNEGDLAVRNMFAFPLCKQSLS